MELLEVGIIYTFNKKIEGDIVMNNSTIKLRNIDLETVHEFLIGITLKGRKSRSRSILCKKIHGKFAERAEQRNEIQKGYAKTNGEGEMITDDNGVISFETDEKRKLCIEEINEHDKELAVIDCTEFMDHMKTLLDSLDELDEDLSGTSAYSYDLICEQLETLKSEKEGK